MNMNWGKTEFEESITDEFMYKLTDIARLLNVYPGTVRVWIKAGKLVAIRFPGNRGDFRISGKALKKFLNTNGRYR